MSILGLALATGACDTKPSNGPPLSPADSGQSLDSGGEPGSAVLVDCDASLTGVPWGEPSVSDHNPELEEILDSIDFGEMPETIDISGLLAIYRGGIAYALEISPADLGDTLNRDAVLASGHMGRVVLASLNTEAEAGIDYTLFRQGLQRYYTCSRAFPMTLEGFGVEFGEIPSAYSDIASAAKCGTRRLRINAEAGVYVAESIWEGAVRETEILLDNNRADGQLDFAVYGADGVLTDRSQFPTLGGGPHLIVSAPYACMTCHLNSSADPDTWGYDTLYPTGTGPCAE